MLEPLHKRCVALLACVALLIATTGFLVHGYRADGKSHNEVRCEFCAQLAGSAGTPAVIALGTLIRPVHILLRLPAVRFPRVIPLPCAYRSRAPPLLRSI